jgi:energy-coupling factor transporter ATP-binding protein EcfA2
MTRDHRNTPPVTTTSAPVPASLGSAVLQELKYVQNVGRFEKAIPTANASFGPCTLIFGENGWGKSTLADILRSLTMNNPAIILGRKTLAGGPDQKVTFRIGAQPTVFQDGAWSGPRPRIAIYDSVFINGNVFSGDVVSADHLKNQYGLVVGEDGVRRVWKIVACAMEVTTPRQHFNLVARHARASRRVSLRYARLEVPRSPLKTSRS